MFPVSFFPKNNQGRDFIVGDLHGCASLLHTALEVVNFHKSSDRLFAVGDLIDRGPNSQEILDLLKTHWFFSCKGNHEQMLINHFIDPENIKPHDELWLRQHYKTFTDRQKFIGKWLPILKNLPNVIAVGSNEDKFYVTHAEILEDRLTVDEKMIDKWQFKDPHKTIRRAVWGRALIQAFENGRQVNRAHDKNLPLIYCGHTVTSRPIKIARQIYMDGGAYFSFKESKSFQPALRITEANSDFCWQIYNSNSWEKVPIYSPVTR